MKQRIEPGERNPQRRRDIIVEAATAAIATHGLENSSTATLARAAGMPAGTIAKAFGGKHDLLLEICERHLDALLLAVEQADLPAVRTRRRLDAMATALLDAIDADAPRHRVLAIGLTRLPPDQQGDLKRKQSWLSTLFAEALEAALPQFGPRRVLAAPATRSLLVLLQEYARWAGDLAKPISRPAYARFAVSSILGGLKCELRVRSGSR